MGKRKVLLSTFIIAISIFSGFAQSEIDVNEAHWLYNIEKASNESHIQHKPILVSFSGSDWCAPCMRLEKDLFSTNDFREFSNEKLILLKLDFPARKQNKLSEEQLAHNEMLAEKYNKTGAFPLVLLLDENGHVMGEMNHPTNSTKDYLNSILSILNSDGQK